MGRAKGKLVENLSQQNIVSLPMANPVLCVKRSCSAEVCLRERRHDDDPRPLLIDAAAQQRVGLGACGGDIKQVLATVPFEAIQVHAGKREKFCEPTASNICELMASNTYSTRSIAYRGR